MLAAPVLLLVERAWHRRWVFDAGFINFRAATTTPTVMQLLDHEPLGYIQEVGLKPDFLGGNAIGE